MFSVLNITRTLHLINNRMSRKMLDKKYRFKSFISYLFDRSVCEIGSKAVIKNSNYCSDLQLKRCYSTFLHVFDYNNLVIHLKLLKGGHT
jgi:hypothetical protein